MKPDLMDREIRVRRRRDASPKTNRQSLRVVIGPNRDPFLIEANEWGCAAFRLILTVRSVDSERSLGLRW
jgi:hypothetical protein